MNVRKWLRRCLKSISITIFANCCVYSSINIQIKKACPLFLSKTVFFQLSHFTSHFQLSLFLNPPHHMAVSGNYIFIIVSLCVRCLFPNVQTHWNRVPEKSTRLVKSEDEKKVGKKAKTKCSVPHSRQKTWAPKRSNIQIINKQTNKNKNMWNATVLVWESSGDKNDQSRSNTILSMHRRVMWQTKIFHKITKIICNQITMKKWWTIMKNNCKHLF